MGAATGDQGNGWHSGSSGGLLIWSPGANLHRYPGAENKPSYPHAFRGLPLAG